MKVSPTGLVKIAHWISSDIPDEIIQSAHQIASAQRQKNNDPTPISIGYLDSILATLLMGLKANSSSSALVNQPGYSIGQAPWYATDAGVEKRANEKSYHKLSTETFIQFKHRVLAYEQVSPEQYNETLRMKGVL